MGMLNKIAFTSDEINQLHTIFLEKKFDTLHTCQVYEVDTMSPYWGNTPDKNDEDLVFRMCKCKPDARSYEDGYLPSTIFRFSIDKTHEGFLMRLFGNYSIHKIQLYILDSRTRQFSEPIPVSGFELDKTSAQSYETWFTDIDKDGCMDIIKREEHLIFNPADSTELKKAYNLQVRSERYTCPYCPPHAGIMYMGDKAELYKFRNGSFLKQEDVKLDWNKFSFCTPPK